MWGGENLGIYRLWMKSNSCSLVFSAKSYIVLTFYFDLELFMLDFSKYDTSMIPSFHLVCPFPNFKVELSIAVSKES